MHNTAVDGIGRRDPKRRTKHGAAKRSEARGITFASRTERDMTIALWERAEAARPHAFVLRQPLFDLFQIWTPGLGKPLRFRPDALFIQQRAVRALEPVTLDDPVRGVERARMD